MRRRRAGLIRWILRLVPVVAGVGVAIWLLPRFTAPRPLSEDIFEPGAEDTPRVRAGLEDALVVIPGRPHRFPFDAESQAYRDRITRRVSYRCSTDSRGFRGDEVAVAPASGVTRIVCLGDSITFGHGVDDDETYPAVLQELLRAHGSYEVINAADIGAESRDALEVLRDEVLPLAPHLVTVCVGVNDATNHYLDSFQRDTWGHGGFDREIRAKLRVQLEATVDLAAEAGIDLILVVPPITSFFPLVEGPTIAETVREVARARSVPLVDLQQHFARGEAERGLVLESEASAQRLVSHRMGRDRVLLEVELAPDRTRFIDDRIYDHLDTSGASQALSIDESHPNAAGQRLAAELLRDAIVGPSGE